MSGHLVGAYGMFWDRDEVDWRPGAGRGWQLLGYRGQRRPGLQVCDFRYVAGFYMLWNDFRALYVGLAGGKGGVGARLQDHHENKEDWSRFSWFSFDDVVPAKGYPGWSDAKVRNNLGATHSEILKECEALLITVLGTYTGGAQNRMKFARGKEWTQVTTADYAPDGVCRKVARDGFSDQAPLAEWE